ncbi:hypothetical protein [Rhodopseudomonas sp. P2A-2r]|uniref:hypothetical protein n=1 Tax=unclassified Rhodopseudomonas TaxID=2638247 RepID=UPI002233E607|nr:hypothetical protein [Rhodopseudomonas sp. P2A-2r]UZE49961.1 hypothetical protein ONR75_04050 [Rhodopseudomonas sp. P2A-2r]
MSDGGNDDVLFGRLRRLVATARTVQKRDRRNLLALENDIRAVRAELAQRCALLAQQMKDAGARTVAINAYARTGSLARGLPLAPHKQPTE